MAVPTGNVGRPIAPHRFVAKGQVFERFVQGRSDVDVAIRERGAVMQNKGGSLAAMGLNGFVQAYFFPGREASRFPLYEVCSHREIRFR